MDWRYWLTIILIIKSLVGIVLIIESIIYTGMSIRTEYNKKGLKKSLYKVLSIVGIQLILDITTIIALSD